MSYSDIYSPQSTTYKDSAEVEVLEHYEHNREKFKDERDNMQKKTFTKWVNKHLSKAGQKVEDLFRDLQDGYKLIALLEALTGERLNRENGYTRFHRIQNVQYCLDFLKRKNIKLVNIRPEDIVEGNGKLILGLIWTIILNFQVSVIKQRQVEQWAHESTSVVVSGRTTTTNQVSEILHGSDASSARDALLQWARKVTAGYPRVDVKNFSSSWRDGLAFNAILHRYRPNLIDWNKISDPSVSNRERLENAFAAAEREFGVSRLLDPEDVDTDNPDEKSIITYVSSLYEALPHLPELSRGNQNDIISRLTRGIGITNEKLDLILHRIEDVESRVDKASPSEIERTVNEIVEDLNALEAPIDGFFEDVEELKAQQHPEANDFYRQVYGLHQRRTVYLDRLTNQLLVRLGVRTEAMRKESQARLESIRQSTFSRVEECIEWVRIRLEKLTEMEFLENLETLEEMFEQHKLDNRDIQDFRQNVDECIARQAEVSAEDTHEYCELLRVLESEYQQLRDLSAGRMLDLDSLIAFVRAAQMELVWVTEREDIEVSRNWSDIKQLDLPMLQNYYKQLLHEMELRERQYNDVHNQGAALLNQGHPAIHVIEVYLRTMQNKWDWLLSLSKCLEEHLRDALNLKSFLEEAADAEAWMEEQSQRLENNYNRTDFSLEEGERFLKELDEIKDILNKYHNVLMALTERCATISPLWQRGERITRPITVTALCDFSEKNITIKAGDDVTLLDNSDLIKWQIRDLSGTEGVVPSVVFRIPPPDSKLTNYLNRLLQQFEKLRKLWDKKHRMVRFNMVLNTMKTIQGWNLDTFNSIDPDQRDAIMRALNDDANKLLAELDPNDPLALRLREELRKTNEHFWNLLNASQKPPEPDYSSQFDEKMNELLRKLEEAWRKLNDNVGKPVSRTPEELEKVIHAHKQFEDDLQALDTDVANVKELFRQLPNPTPTQRVNHDRLNTIWEELWDLSRMYVERIKVLESVLNGMIEVADIVKAHEVTLNSFDDMPAALDKLRGHHAQLLEMNMVLQQQQSVIDSLNKNVALLRQHVARTRLNQGSHPDVDRIEEEVQQLNVRWENVGAQVADRLKATERALQIQMVYRSEYECEMAWLDRVEETINRLRKPDELRPEEYQNQLDILAAEYAQLQERTEAIENVNREGGKFIREAKGFDSRMGQFGDAVVGIHGPSVRQLFRRTQPQPKNGAQIVTEELEALNRRFAQLSSLILERRNHMQVLIQNWKRQKQDEVAEIATVQYTTLVDMAKDLGHFRETMYKEHLKFDLDLDSAANASQNVQSIKESLDSWREHVKGKLDAVDLLCRENADNMTPDQFAELKAARNQLALDYENVVRTVEGVYGRLNEITAFLVSFSTMASEMQSWMTDRTRLAGEIKIRSADSNTVEQSKNEARTLLNEVHDREEKLKAIASVLSKLETEIELMYESAPEISEKSIHAGDVRQTMYRVQDDYAELVKQCQDLIQFQNRLITLDDELYDSNKKLDDWIESLESNLQEVNNQKWTPEEKLERLDEIGVKASESDDVLRQADQAVLRLLLALEGSGVGQDIKDQRSHELNKRKKRLGSLLNDIQENKNQTSVQLSANEEIKDAVEGLSQWVASFEKIAAQPFSLPMKREPLNALKREEQRLRSELESKKATLDGLNQQIDQSLNSIGTHTADALKLSIEDAKRRLQRSSSNLQGLRDNINDSLEGVQSLYMADEALTQACDNASTTIRNTNPRDRIRLNSCGDEIESLNNQLNKMKNTVRILTNMPHATDTDAIENMVENSIKKVENVKNDLEDKQAKMAETNEFEAIFDKMRENTANWLGSIDARLMELKPVSIIPAKLREQREQCSGLTDEHREGLLQLEELESFAMKLCEGEAGSRNSITPRHVMDLVARYNGQADALRNRMDKINGNEKKAVELEDKQHNLRNFMIAQNKLIKNQALPNDKEELKSVFDQLDRVEKLVRQEQRNAEETRLNSRELARTSSMDEECNNLKNIDDELANNWTDLGEAIQTSRQKNSQAELLIDGIAQLDKFIGSKGRMLDVIGAPSTEAALARSQRGQLELLKAEAENEKSILDKLSGIKNKLAANFENPQDEPLLSKVSNLEQRWISLEQDICDKQAGVEKAEALGKDIKATQKEIKHRIEELESGLEKATNLHPSEICQQLTVLDGLKQQFSGLDELVRKMGTLVEQSDELEIDPGNKADICEEVDNVKKRAEEIENKIENVKKAAISARDEGNSLEDSLDQLLDVARNADTEIKEAQPISADAGKLSEETENIDAIYSKVMSMEGDVSLIKAKVSDQLKRNHDPALKNKLDELHKIWNPLLSNIKDRRNLLGKVSELVRSFAEHEGSLSKRLKEDEKEMLAIINSNDKSTISDSLSMMENVLGRRMADGEALSGIVNRIDTAAPGPDANKMRRKVDNLIDDCNMLAKKAKLAALNAQKGLDVNNKLNRLFDEAQQFVSSEKEIFSDENDQSKSLDRIHSKLNEVDSYWSRKIREINLCIDDAKSVTSDFDSSFVDARFSDLNRDFTELLQLLRDFEKKLSDKQSAADAAQEKTSKLVNEISGVHTEVSDLDPVGRSKKELARQKSDCDELLAIVKDKEKAIDELLCHWKDAYDQNVVSQPAFEANRTAIDNAKKLLGRSSKKLTQRAQKISETCEEVDKIGKEADKLQSELNELRNSDALTLQVDVSDPQKNAQKLKELRNLLKPLGDKVDNLASECKVLIRSAGPDADTSELSASLEQISGSWSALQASVADRELNVDTAVQQMGRYEDAHKGLLNWLDETEDILKNQKKPSPDGKVAKAQLQAYDVLLKFIEEKEASVNGFSVLMGKIMDMASTTDEKSALKQKEESVRKRYNDLLEGAQDKQGSLMEAVDLAERLTECVAPLENWLGKAEKSVQSLAVIPTDPERMREKLETHQQIADEVETRSADLNTISAIVPVLRALVNVDDAAQLEKDANQLKGRFESLESRVDDMKEMLNDVAIQVEDFDHDTNELFKWINETEGRLAEMEELAIEPDDLLEQCNLLSDLAESITGYEKMVLGVIMVGQVLCSNASPDDAVLVQNRLNNLKMRYQALMSSADDKLAAIEKAIPLSERFHQGFDSVMQWVEAVEEDLLNVDDTDVETQAHLIFTIEEDVARSRPEVDELVAVSSQLQALCSPERAEELYLNTAEMNKRVHEIANKVARRAERLDLTERQSREVLDELEFIIEWLQDASERIVTAQPPSIDPEFVKIQLKNQKIMNEDVTSNKTKLRELISEAKKVIRQLGPDGAENPSFAAINEKCEYGRKLVDDVSSFCMDRTECLEQAVALLAQLTSEFDELSSAIDHIDDELRCAPEILTITPSNELRRMHDHNSELIGALSAYKPLVDRFQSDVKAMQELCSEHEGGKLGELADEIVLKYHEVFDAARKRGQVLDSIFEATSGFGERLEKFVENLQGAADKLRENTSISADPNVLEAKLAENMAVLESLRDKEGTYAALKESASELLANAPQGDIAAQEVVNKLERLEKLWRDIEEEAALRGSFLKDVLEKAKTFWSELDICQKAVDDLRVRLDCVEPATGQPEQIQQQQAVMSNVAGAMSTTGPRILALRGAGNALSDVIPPEEQVIVKAQVDAVQENWSTITMLFAEKNRDLIAAMDEAMSFHGDLSGLLEWLDRAERYVQSLPPADNLKIDEIPIEMESLHQFKNDVDKHALVKEQLAQTAAQLANGASSLHAAAVRQPISDLNARWARLYAALADREHKIEKALLQMGRLSDAADQLISWIDNTRESLSELKEGGATNLRQVEIKLCKLAVIKNDVHSHEQRVTTLNSAAQHLLKEESDSEIAAKMDSMNYKWKELQNDLYTLTNQLEKARGEAENVGGELERWLSWLQDIEPQLSTTKPPGGLPETAEVQFDDFRVLKAEVEQNSPSLDEYLRKTEMYLAEHGNDHESWIGRNYVQMKSKWARVKELCVDREKKLQVALNEAVALHDAMIECDAWLVYSEKKLTALPPVSRILEVLESQLESHDQFTDEVNERKQIVADLRATGTRLQYYCEAKDGIPIKNKLVTLKHRFEKVLSRNTDRGKQLTIAAEEARTWISGVESLENWIDDVEGRLAEESPSTSSVDRLKLQLENVVEIQQELAERQPQYDITKKRGQTLADHAPKAEAKIINTRNNGLTKRWKSLTSLCLDKQRDAEQAVIEGGAFDEAMQKLEQWIDDEMSRFNSDDNDKVYGDLETVRQLKEAEANRAAERKAKRQGVDSVLKKSKELLDKGVEEAPAVQESANRLQEKWAELDEAARKRAASIDDAEKIAAEFDQNAHEILDWLAAAENKLKKPVVEISAALAGINDIKDEMDKQTPKKESVLAQGQDIRSKCHPKADQNVKHWLKVVGVRWNEIQEKIGDREFHLLEEEQNEKDLDEKLKELRDFVSSKRDDLNSMTSVPLPSDLETLDCMQKDHEHLDFDLRERQPDIENATKSVRKNIRNPVAEQLSADWKQLWLESMGHQAALDKQHELLKELKRLEGWKWEEWKERYVEFNDHGKARVTDLFRRIDRSHTGRVPRNIFIDAIIASRFPTSRLEMEKVANLFDKGDGLIESKQFINALRFDLANRVREPITENQKINEEISRQSKACSCCKPYVIEKISDGHYRFGDTQIKRMVRILRSTVMVRVGGGWESLEEFLGKHDPCRAKGRLNINLLYKDVAPSHAVDTIRAFTKNRHARSGEFSGIPGPIMKIREKSEKSVPMFPHKHERAPSDVSIGESKIARPSSATRFKN